MRSCRVGSALDHLSKPRRADQRKLQEVALLAEVELAPVIAIMAALWATGSGFRLT
jgi:hypothetical protein